MLTAIQSIDEELCDYPASETLTDFLEEGPVWMPTEGRFEPLLHEDFLSVFDAAGQQELVFVPDFPGVDPVQRIATRKMSVGETAFPARGTLAAVDESFLLTVDWDSFFTLFYGPRAFVEGVVRRRNVEGFFATPTTEHWWYNYSLGCSAVTIYPDSWVVG
jgi:hypothetical protein